MRIGLDATPLLGQRSGIGRYVAGLIEGLAGLPGRPDVLLTLFSIRGELPGGLPAGVRAAPRRAPARLLQRAWRRSSWPPVELMTGRVDVFHGTNFTLPPTRRAGGVLTIHDLAYLKHPETVTGDAAQYRHLVHQALSTGARVVAVSQHAADEITAEYRLTPDRVTIAPHGVDDAWAEAVEPSPATRRRLGLPQRYVLFTGNLEPRKNLGTLVRAHADARRADSGIPQLVLAGPAGWGDRWHGSPPDPEHVVLAGFLSEPDLRATVAGAAAVCMPSRYEGFGLPVLEALAAGRPVLASDIGPLREVAGDQALFLDPADEEAWSHALGQVDLIPGSSSSRRARAAEFTWARSAARHLEAYSAAATG